MNRALPFLLLLAAGCTHEVNTSYLKAAQIDVPQHVHRVAIIDRSKAKNPGEHAMAAAEGILTGERIMLDREGARLAIGALSDELQWGPRFEIVHLRVDGRQVDTSVWDTELTARKVKQLCTQAACDAVISLESFDSDVVTTLTQERDGKEIDFEATQTTDLVATFRLYDGRTGQIIDERREGYRDVASSGEEESRQAAFADLPGDVRVYDGASAMGIDYAHRISPHEVRVTRRIFSKGDPELKAGRKALQRGDLAAAEAHLQAVLAATGEPKLRARALHNLAVVAEIQGDLGKALNRAQRAARLVDHGATRALIRVLNWRIGNESRLNQQLAPAPVAIPAQAAIPAQ